MHKLKNVGQLDMFHCPDRCECLSHTKILHPVLVATMCGMANKTMCTVIHLRKKKSEYWNGFCGYVFHNDVTCSRSLDHSVFTSSLIGHSGCWGVMWRPVVLCHLATGLLVCLSGNMLGLDQRSYSTPGAVSAWMGDRLWMGKPLCHRHPGLLSLSHPSVGRQDEYPAKDGQ